MHHPSIHCVFQGVGDSSAIFLSNFKAAQDLSLLQSTIIFDEVGLGIGAIVSVARGGKVAHPQDAIPHYSYIPADDNVNYDLSQHFDATFDFIDQARNQSNVLVHCASGASRSATIVIAYLIRKYGYSVDYLIALLRRKRSVVLLSSILG